jgi:hypothetical protein
MTRLLLCTATILALTVSANAQSSGPAFGNYFMGGGGFSGLSNPYQYTQSPTKSAVRAIRDQTQSQRSKQPRR